MALWALLIFVASDELINPVVDIFAMGKKITAVTTTITITGARTIAGTKKVMTSKTTITRTETMTTSVKTTTTTSKEKG